MSDKEYVMYNENMAKPVSVAEQLEQMLNQNIEYAAKTKMAVLTKLESVMRSSEPCCDKLCADEEAWPPHFDNLRSGLRQIVESLDAINNAIARCEL